MEKHDALGRRHRNYPTSTDKRVTPQPRDLLWFQKLQQHGPLSSTYLHAFSQHLARNKKRSRDRLTDLFNESRTPHRGAYLARPWQQLQTLDARYQDLVYDLAAPAELALKAHGLWTEHGASAGGPWRHRYMVAAITASIELATLADPYISFISQHRILSRANAVLRYPVRFRNRTIGRDEKCDLIPDAIFGLEYRRDGSTSYRFFVVEADRGTEPSRASTFNRKSHLRNFLQYREYIGRRMYEHHLMLTAPLMVLNVIADETTMARMLRLASEVSPAGNTYQLFQCHSQFGPYLNVLPPLAALMNAEWHRAGTVSLRLNRPHSIDDPPSPGRER